MDETMIKGLLKRGIQAMPNFQYARYQKGKS